MIKVAAKIFSILEILNSEDKLSLKEITQKTHFPKPTVFRLLDTLQELGYVDQEAGTQNYKLGLKFMSFIKSSNNTDLVTIAKPYMENFHNKFNETVNLAKLVNQQAVYIHITESNQAFRISDNVGDRASFHSTAIGKAIISFLTDEKQKEILKNYHFVRFTKRTIVKLSDLRKEINRIKKIGFAIDNEEGHEGVICIGAPIFNKDNSSFAALSISMPKVRADKSKLNRIKIELPEVCRKISLSSK